MFQFLNELRAFFENGPVVYEHESLETLKRSSYTDVVKYRYYYF